MHILENSMEYRAQSQVLSFATYARKWRRQSGHMPPRPDIMSYNMNTYMPLSICRNRPTDVLLLVANTATNAVGVSVRK